MQKCDSCGHTNLSTFKFHSKVLIENGLLEKLERGVYQTTELGNIILDMVKRADEISNKF